MFSHIINVLIIIGSVLMIVNISGFVKYAVFIKGRQKLNKEKGDLVRANNSSLFVLLRICNCRFHGYVTNSMTIEITKSSDRIVGAFMLEITLRDQCHR